MVGRGDAQWDQDEGASLLVSKNLSVKAPPPPLRVRSRFRGAPEEWNGAHHRHEPMHGGNQLRALR